MFEFLPLNKNGLSMEVNTVLS